MGCPCDAAKATLTSIAGDRRPQNAGPRIGYSFAALIWNGSGPRFIRSAAHRVGRVRVQRRSVASAPATLYRTRAGWRKDPHRRKRLTPLALSGACGGASANHLLCDTGIASLQVSAGPNPPPLVPAAWDCRSVFFGKPMPARLLLFSLCACTRLTAAGQAATPAWS